MHHARIIFGFIMCTSLINNASAPEHHDPAKTALRYAASGTLLTISVVGLYQEGMNPVSPIAGSIGAGFARPDLAEKCMNDAQDATVKTCKGIGLTLLRLFRFPTAAHEPAKINHLAQDVMNRSNMYNKKKKHFCSKLTSR